MQDAENDDAIPEYYEDDERAAENGDDDDDEDVVVDVEEDGDATNRVFSFAFCGLCMSTLRLPVTTPCGHNFCHECLSTKLAGATTNARRVCPTCAKPIRSEWAHNMQFNCQLAALVAIANQCIAPADQGSTLDMLLRGMHEQRPHDARVDFRVMQKVIHGACASEANLARLKSFSDELHLRLLHATMRRDVVLSGLPTPPGKTPPRLCVASFLTEEECGVVADRMVLETSKRAFPELDVSTAYNLVVMRTAVSDFSEQGLEMLARRPVYGIVAAGSIVLVGCAPIHLADLLATVLPAWNAEYGSVVATWIMSERMLMAPTLLWIAAKIGHVQALRSVSRGQCAFNLKTKPYEREIPAALLARFRAMFPSHTHTCILGDHPPVPGWTISKVVDPKN